MSWSVSGACAMTCAAVIFLAPGALSSAHAQRSNFDAVTLAPGFMPDPSVTQGSSGGQSEAQRLNASCRGWIASNPDHIFNVQRRFRFLRVFAVSNQDTTLVIQTPDGQLRCNDDTYGQNPSVEGSWPVGTYRIWVGSYTRGTRASYRLHFTELASTTPSSVGSAPIAHQTTVAQRARQTLAETPGSTETGADLRRLDLSGRRSNSQGAWLQSGFTPDPHVLTGSSGGRIAARRVATGCAGWIARRPDHVLNLEGGFGFFRVAATSSQDTTLVVMAPDGSWYCNDDSQGTNPEVRRNRWEPGQYLVWVGSYRQGQNADYRLSFSELHAGTSGSRVAQTQPNTRSTAGALDVSGRRSNFQDARLRSGFTPDPHRLAGTSGGAISASDLGPDCQGWVARQPDHILNLQTRTRFFRIFADSRSDITLVVRAPDGRWLCNDDTNGTNPALEGESWNAGRYLIWVGSYNRGEHASYTLGLTELQSVTR
ncbi:MAG: hypothetical protein GXP55_09235 [Deltaproteobacteria bacterium]|nr:hypothetical protein [Deltaproteobacteria bacterium]